MADYDIKEVIRDFVNFDIENNYYQKEDKEELVRQFKQILYEDDVTVRQFLKSFFESTKNLAEQYSLIAGEGEVVEEPIEEPEEPEELEDAEEPEDEEPEDATEEIETTEESIHTNKYVKTAANILYE